ncbi:MAG: prolyl oligopeptidase family serine peptidase [Pseudomonadales bacterium]
MRIQHLTVLFIIGLFSISAYSAAKAKEEKDTSHLFTSNDIFELEYASDPRISPDGRSIVYVRNSMDIMTDRARGNLWVVDFKGTEHRALLSGRKSYSSPRWSADGKRLAYISTAEGSAQLYSRWMDTGQTALLTNLTESPGAISWSPDGKWIAFTMHVDANSDPLAKAPEKPEKAKWAPAVKLIDTLVYRADGHGFLEAGYSHVFIVSTEGGTPRRLTKGNFNHDGPLSWTPDSKNIVFAANRNKDWEYQPAESELFMVSIDDMALTQLTTRKGPDFEPAVSPDGRYIAYTGFDDREQGYQLTFLYVMDLDGRNSRAITTGFDRSVQNPRWVGNNKIYFQHDDHGVAKLASTTLSGKVTTVAKNVGGTTLGRPYTSGSYSIARNGAYAMTINSPHRPADVAAGKRGKPKQLTHLNDDVFSHKQLGQVTALQWSSSHDDRDIQGWVVTPPDFDPNKKYPFILEIHGGPFAAYGPNFTAELQRYATEGYVVLYANPRGSTSYGEEFGNLIHHAYPGHDYDDLMSGVDAVISKGYVDENNLFVTGGSGGGVLSAWIVGKTDRFRAAVVAKPVINMASFVLTSDAVNYFYKYWFTDYPWKKPEEYWERSPLSLVGNVTTPTMLLTGESDYRTPISESEQFYVALKLRKIDTALLRVPGASHGIASRPSNLIAKVDNILAWFEKYRTDKDKGEKKE